MMTDNARASQIHDKPMLRVRACQHVLDNIVEQDEVSAHCVPIAATTV